jgi:hypothetical protein
MAGDDNSSSSSTHLPNDYEWHLLEEYEEDGQEQDFCSTVPGTPDVRQQRIQPSPVATGGSQPQYLL